jgi:hypothetical protein
LFPGWTFCLGCGHRLGPFRWQAQIWTLRSKWPIFGRIPPYSLLANPLLLILLVPLLVAGVRGGVWGFALAGAGIPAGAGP